MIFNELSGRLLPFYHTHENIRKLIDQCDLKIAELNPFLPIGQIFNSPAWINLDSIDIGIINKIEEKSCFQFDLLESEFNGRILVYKSPNATCTKFYDIDLLEPVNDDVFTGKGKIYCSKDGDFVCNLESPLANRDQNSKTKLIIRQVHNSGEFYGSVEFDSSHELGHVYLSSNYATVILRKIPSPILINLREAQILETFPFLTSFCSISEDDKVLFIHSEKNLNYFLLPQRERLMSLDCFEIPEMVLSLAQNTKLFVLTKDSKEVYYYELLLEKKYYTKVNLIQDKEIVDLKCSQNEKLLLICSLNCIYVFEIISNPEPYLKLKLGVFQIENHLRKQDPFLLDQKPKNFLTGFGTYSLSDDDQVIIYCTYYSYLACFDARSGELLRLFQSSLSANRIIKTLTSKLQSPSMAVSLLDNYQILIWNLDCLGSFKDLNYENMNSFNDQVKNCLFSTSLKHTSDLNSNLLVTYSKTYPDVKMHDFKNNCAVQSLIKSVDLCEKCDNIITSIVKSIVMCDRARFCFIQIEIDDFFGKRMPDEKDFIKRVCCLIDLMNHNEIIEKLTFVIKKMSRFEIDAKFMYKDVKSCYLLVKQVSCVNDFDPFNESKLDWTEFETQFKIYGPILDSSKPILNLYDEFKIDGELLCDFCLTNDFIFACLAQECVKLYDKNQPLVVKAKRYDQQMNIYEIFDSKIKSLKVQKFSLNEFLSIEEISNKNVLLDLRLTHDQNIFLIYSKNGAKKHNNLDSASKINMNQNTFDYDYEKLKFIRDLNGNKGAVLYEPRKNEVLKKFSIIFSPVTIIENLVTSTSSLSFTYALDNLFNLYECVNSGKLIRNLISKLNGLKLSIEYTKFILDGRYILTSESSLKRIFIIRCYDSSIVARLLFKSEIECIRIGEQDRTLVIGCRDGSVLALKILLDLEKKEVKDTYINYYRRRSSSKEEIQQITIADDRYKNLRNDLKRISHSATAHRSLKSRETLNGSSMSIRQIESGFMGSNSNSKSHLGTNSALDNYDFHPGVSKINLSTLTMGLKHSPNSKACIIQ